MEKGRDLEQVFIEAYEAVPTLDGRVEKWRWTLKAAYGAIGLLGMLTHPGIGLLAAMGFRVAEKKVTDLVAPELAGITVNPLSTAIWNFRKKLNSLKNCKKV